MKEPKMNTQIVIEKDFNIDMKAIKSFEIKTTDGWVKATPKDENLGIVMIDVLDHIELAGYNTASLRWFTDDEITFEGHIDGECICKVVMNGIYKNNYIADKQD